MKTLLLVFSAGILLIAPITYATSIISGKTRPHRLTRLAVMAALLVIFSSALAARANVGTLLLAGISAGHGVLIFALSLWRGVGGGKRLFDWTCFGTSLLGLLAWRLSGDALIGMWFAIIADCTAYLPAFVKTWMHPDTESPWFYALSLIGAALTLIAYPLRATSVFQLYIMACSLVMIFCIYHTKLFLSKQAQ